MTYLTQLRAVMVVLLVSLKSPSYMKRHRVPTGSPFTKMTGVILAALNKWKVPVPSDLKQLHELDFSRTMLGFWDGHRNSRIRVIMAHTWEPRIHSRGSYVETSSPFKPCHFDPLLHRRRTETPGLRVHATWWLDGVDGKELQFLASSVWLEKAKSDDQTEKKWGVLKAVDANEKTTKVKWECGQYAYQVVLVRFKDSNCIPFPFEQRK
ncbi:NRT1/ PTR family protein 5.2 [Tanacetum coccineum]